MSIIDIIAILISLTALFSFLNHCYLRLPTAIGVMLMGLALSLALIGLDLAGFAVADQAERILLQIDFDETLLHGMLSFLLFAGALHVNLADLFEQRRVIGLLATIGILVSALLIGTVLWLVSGPLGLPVPFIYCLLFGALISPTDPIAVLSILKSAGAPKTLEMKITGESLFNDGVGVVLFILVSGIAYGQHEATAGGVASLFLVEVVGGAVYGLAIGTLAFLMMRRAESYHVEVLITLAVVTGGYSLATALHLSGPIAVVIAGLMIGNHGRMLAMNEISRRNLDTFWELLDEILNAVLFVLIGLEILVISFNLPSVIAGVIAIPVVLAARFVSVALPLSALHGSREFSPHALKILTWGGLRGGISVALALSLPAGPEREILVTITYCVVVFSIAVQGLTIGRLLRWAMAK